jgi:hypothetical protein
MSQPRMTIEKLRNYLEGLTPEARAIFLEKLEREATGGDGAATVLLQKVREDLRASTPAKAAATPPRAEAPPRILSPQQLFFAPVEPFLIEEAAAVKSRGCVPRTSLDAIWTWLSRDLLPADAKAFSDAVTAAFKAGDEAAALKLAKSFQDHAGARMREALEATARDEVARRRLSAQIGSEREIEELRDVLAILRARDALAAIGSRLPTAIRNLADQPMEAARAVFNVPVTRHADVLPYALALLKARLAQPWQVIRIAIKAVESDSATKIAESPFAVAVELAFADLDRRVGALKVALRQRDPATLAPVVKDIHDYARGFRTELDMRSDSPWGRRLAAVRKEVAALLSTELATCSADIRHLLKPRSRPEAASESAISPAQVAAAESAIEFLALCRTYAGEIALNEATLRATSELNALLDSGSALLIDGYRIASEAEKPFRRSQLEAVSQIGGKVLGASYAQTLTKAVELAEQGRAAEQPAEPRRAARS